MTVSLLGGGKVILSKKQESFCRLLACASARVAEGGTQCSSLWSHSSVGFWV